MDAAETTAQTTIPDVVHGFGLLSFYSSAVAATMVVSVQTTTVDVMTTITIAVVPSSGSSYYPAFVETAAFSNSYLFR